MEKKNILNFLVKARTKTYAGGGGEVKPALAGSKQLEYKEGSWSYRDVYNIGNKIFMGLETIYLRKKPVWSMSYYGDFKKLSEKEVGDVLRQALIVNQKTARLWHKVEWKRGDYKYTCTPDGPGSIDEISGYEEISKKGKKVYFFFYAGGHIG